jgi:hypothetical protein
MYTLRESPPSQQVENDALLADMLRGGFPEYIIKIEQFPHGLSIGIFPIPGRDNKN